MVSSLGKMETVGKRQWVKMSREHEPLSETSTFLHDREWEQNNEIEDDQDKEENDDE